MNKKNVFAFAIALASMGAFAQQNDSINKLEEVVVSDSKFALSKEKSGKVIVKITAEELNKRSGQSVAAILSSVAGIEVNGNQSAAGKNQEFYIRGGRSRQNLVVIDGVPVTDASGISLQYDLRLIPVEQVESIEIMKGAASTLYGSGAATGVINIRLKKSAEKAISGNAYMSLGSQETSANENNYSPNDFSQGFSVNGTVNKVNYLATLNHSYVTGMSEAKGDNFEADTAEKLNATVKLGFKPTEKLNFDFFANFDLFKNNFDNSFDNLNNPDVKENKAASEQFRFGFSPKYKYKKGEFVIHSAFNTIERNYDIFSSWTNSVNISNYKSNSANVDAFNKYSISEELFVVLGGQFQFHEMNANSQYEAISDKTAHFSTIDPYLTAVYNSKMGFNINAGARLNVHNIYGNHLIYNVNPSFSLKELPIKFLASYSTAYITPSLYQLYSPYGNLTLKPEENSTVEAGFEVNLLKNKLTFNTVAFQREETNTFDFFTDTITWTSQYINREGTYVAKGIESMVAYSFNKAIKLSGNYSFTQTEAQLSRLIPKHKVNAAIDLKASSRTFLHLNYQFVDKRTDSFYDSANYAVVPVKLDAYKLVNATIRHELFKDRMTVFASVSNLFNEDFTELVGYNTKGRNFKLGFNFLF